MLDVIPEDPDDNRILECAIAAQAGFVVSGDGHLLRVGSYRRILKVADFMVLLPMEPRFPPCELPPHSKFWSTRTSI
jgi:hypothetical protein